MTGEQPGWTKDENGTRHFRHSGWEIKVWEAIAHYACVDVLSPFQTAEVSIHSHCMQISGGAETVSIPWPVVEAMIEARKMAEEINWKAEQDD